MSTLGKFYLYKRSNGIYYLGFLVNGKRQWKSTGARTKSDALKSATNFHDLIDAKPKQVLLTKFMDDFLPFARTNYSRKTADFYRFSFSKLHAMFGDVTLPSLSMWHLDHYRTERLKDVSGHTVNREMQALRAAMYTAVEWRFLASNPFAKMRQVALPERQPTYFSKENFRELLSSIEEGWLKEVILFAVLTGMRRGEILNLRWRDVEMSKKLISVQSHSTFRTKNGKRRVVPMNEVVFNLLSAKASMPTGEYVFNMAGRKINDDRACKKLKKYVRKLLGGDCKLHFHSLRHTFATWLVQGGVNIYEVQKLLGHSSVKVTEVYSHLAASELHHSVNQIELPWVKANPT